MLVTLEDMKVYLKIAADDETYDDILTDMITATGKQFDNYCKRDFEVADYTLYLDGNGLDHIFLKNYPINEITSIHIDTDRNYTDDTEVTEDNYTTYDDEGQIALIDYAFDQGIFPKVRKCIKIVCNLGYTTDVTGYDLPDDLWKAAKDQTKYAFRKWQNSEEGKSSYSTVNNSISLIENTDIIKMIKPTLDRYRNRYYGNI